MAEDKLHIDPKIKEWIKVAKDLLIHVMSYWYLLLVFVMLAMIIGKVMKKDPVVKYVAELTFTINQLRSNTNSNQSTDVAGLVTEFGFGGNKSTQFNANRLIELSKTNAVLSDFLFREYEIDGDSNYLANHFRNIHYDNVVDSNYFKHFVSVDSLTRSQNATLKNIINQIRGRYIYFTVSPSRIFKLTTKSTNEEFSRMLAEGFYEGLSELYVDGAIAKANSTYKFAEDRLEAATNKMLSSERELARWQDGSQNLIKRSAHLKEIDLQRKVKIYNSVYLEALKSNDSAKINLENQRPIFQKIDPPSYPLSKEVSSSSNITLFAIVGAIAFFLFITLSLYFYKNYGYLLKELFE